MDTGALTPDREIFTIAELALFLRGSDDSFTGDLLRLVAKADPGNRSQLRSAFPEAVAAWEEWQACSPTPTAAELRAALDKRSRDGRFWGTL